MKKFIIIPVLLMLIILSGCKKDIVILTPSKALFENTESFWQENELVNLIDNGELGSRPELALVPLVFDEELNLHSPTSFNLLKEEETKETMFTDLKTFQKITKRYDLEQYAQQIFFSNQKGVFVYEPYVEKQMTREEQLDFLEMHKDNLVEKTNSMDLNKPAESRYSTYSPTEYPNFLWVADIATGWHPSRNPITWLGHTGVVYSLDNGNTTGGNPHKSDTKNMEALGFGYADQIATTPFNAYWNKDGFIWQVLIYNPKGSNQNRENVKNFLYNQSTDSYGFTSKDNWTKWYCSKLAWRAYKSYMACDLDYDGGYWVLPADVANAALAQTTDARAYNFYR